MQHTNNMNDQYIGLGGGGQIPVHELNPTHQHDPYLLPPPPQNPYRGLFGYESGWRSSAGLQFGYESGSMDPFGLQAELKKMSAQEIMDAKALAASKSHSEAERRRRERINNHLAKLRSLLPNNTKTDKASLLAEVIQHLKELKRQTSTLSETNGPVPTETNELTVDNASEDGRLLIRASICCDDRSDLLPDLIKTLKALRLRTLKAEITTLGGRINNVLFVTGENDLNNSDTDYVVQQEYCISAIHEAFQRIVEKSNGDESGSGSAKRQRTNML